MCLCCQAEIVIIDHVFFPVGMASFNDIMKMTEKEMMRRGSVTKQMLVDALMTARSQLKNQDDQNIAIEFDAALEKRLTPFVDMINDLKSKIDSLSTQLMCVQNENKKLQHSKQEDFEIICREAEERIKKRKYLIVSGLSEPCHASLREREMDDSVAVKEIAHKLGITDFEPKEVHRIGKINQSRPRLLRFKAANLQIKSELLRNSKRLRLDAKFKNVFLDSDTTLIQRTRNRALREEIKSRREAGEDVVIYRGEIVERIKADHQNFPGSF